MSTSMIDRPFSSDNNSRTFGAGGPRFDQLEDVARQEAADRRRLRWMILAAAAVHAVLLIVALPRGQAEAAPPRDDKVFVVKTVRLKPPPAAPQKAIPKPKKKRIPMPDPTPDEPEPLIEELEIDVPDLAPVGDADFPVSFPDAPAARVGVGSTGSDDVLQVGEDVSAPRRLFDPQPAYTEAARAARIQGVVILQAIIDVAGKVTDVKVLKGLPEGLDRSALETIKTWQFEPALRAGLPVAVYLNLTVRFSLQ